MKVTPPSFYLQREDRKKKQMTRAAVRLAIEDTLEDLPEAYVGDMLESKANSVYQYVYDL